MVHVFKTRISLLVKSGTDGGCLFMIVKILAVTRFQKIRNSSFNRFGLFIIYSMKCYMQQLNQYDRVIFIDVKRWFQNLDTGRVQNSVLKMMFLYI